MLGVGGRRAFKFDQADPQLPNSFPTGNSISPLEVLALRDWLAEVEFHGILRRGFPVSFVIVEFGAKPDLALQLLASFKPKATVQLNIEVRLSAFSLKPIQVLHGKANHGW